MDKTRGFDVEISRSRQAGHATESLGWQILGFCRSMGQINSFGIPPSLMDDAVSRAVLGCIRSWQKIPADATQGEVANFFARITQNAFKDFAKIEGRHRRKEAAILFDQRPDRCYSRKGPR